LRFIHEVFFGPPATDMPRIPQEPRAMLLPSALLVVACVLVGTLPGLTIGPMLAAAGTALLGERLPAYELAVWHGVTPALLMSSIALVGGIGYYFVMYLRQRTFARAPLLARFDSKRMFDVVNVAVTRSAAVVARRLYSRRLQTQLVLLVGAACAAAAATAWDRGWPRGGEPLTPLDPVFAALWVVGGACAIGAAWQAKFHRLAALIMVSGAGLVVCLTFAWFSAPDLALTQISVEVVTIVLFLLGLRWLPRRLVADELSRNTLRARSRRGRDALLAAASGIGMATLSFALLTTPSAALLGDYLFANAVTGGGRNVVNVVLVDFRGFDTLGEITVVGTVAVIVYALLRRFRPAPESIAVPQAQRAEAERGELLAQPNELLPETYMRVPAVIARLLLPMAGLVSIYFLLRGHNAPGGGFVGGLVMATAVLVQYMVSGTIFIEARLRIHPQLWIAIGLLAAGAAGVAAWFAERSFLTALPLDLELPLLGSIHLSSVLLFDLGVYMLVFGATVLMLIALAHQSLRSPRRTAAPLVDDESGQEQAVT
jgi:multicomponent K+:H+ antiporter subunit A